MTALAMATLGAALDGLAGKFPDRRGDGGRDHLIEDDLFGTRVWHPREPWSAVSRT
jgi:hypothetical protein